MEVSSNTTEMRQEIILNTNAETRIKTCVHSDVTKYLKTHQIDGIKFLFENCYEQNSGCILAHCMGLGKTLQVISMLHAVINSNEYPTNKILVLCPISTIINWKEEIVHWLDPIDGHRRLQILELDQKDDIHRKISSLQKWSQRDSRSPAACLIMGYEAFRILVNFHLSKANLKKYPESSLRQIRESITNYLLKPADIVVCDEGHVIKNISAAITLAVNQIQTKRRIILTGTPMQNHLMEYYSMVNFVKPNFLGTKQHFNEYFAEPIKDGQHADSCETDIKYMKQRSYALNKKLSKIVQRREISLLKDFLPEKFEFVLFVPLTDIQYKLYKYFLDNRSGSIEYKRLFGDYTCLRKIWTHLKVLDNAHQKSVAKKKRTKNANDDDNTSNDEDDESEFTSSGGLQMVDNDWWRKVIDKSQLESALSSYKMIVLFEILKECQRVGDKCVIFSSFVEVLNVVEFFMQQIDQQQMHGNRKAGLEAFVGPWKKNEDYYRFDGSTPKDRRHAMITKFNDVTNKRTKAFLISAQAGGQGINLFGANRLILLDTSWNPSKDQQSIFRIYRMGQTKHCYIYRLLSMGTMEEKIYSRSVTKQAMSCRVVDKQQIDRHYSMNELYELYSLTKTNWEQRPVPILPKDNLLAHLLLTYPNMVYKYLEHDTLLANKVDEELNEVEKNEAWQRCQEQNLQMRAMQITSVEQQTVTSSSDPSQGSTKSIRVSVESKHQMETTMLESTEPSATMETSSSVPSQTAAILVQVEPKYQMETTMLESIEPSATMETSSSVPSQTAIIRVPLKSKYQMESIEPSIVTETSSVPTPSTTISISYPRSVADEISAENKESSSFGESHLVDSFSDNVSNALNGSLRSNGNEVNQECSEDKDNTSFDNHEMGPSLVCQHLAESTATSNQGLLLPLENVDEVMVDNIEERAARSLSAVAKGLLHTLNAQFTVPSLQQQDEPSTIDDYTTEEEIISSNQCYNLEYRIAFKRPADSNIQRPIKRLKLSVEIDPTAAIPVDHIWSTLPLMINGITVVHQNFVLTEHPQSLNTNSDNLRSTDIRFESNVVNLNGTEPGDDDHSFANSKQVIEQMPTVKTDTEYEQTTLSSSTPWNDVLTDDEEMCPNEVQQSTELVNDLPLINERSLLSNSLDLKTSTGDSSAVDDEKMSPNKQPTCFIVNASILGQDSTADDQMSPNILQHQVELVDDEEIASVYSDCRMYHTEYDSGHDSLADKLESRYDEQQSIHVKESIADDEMSSNILQHPVEPVDDEENVSTLTNGRSYSESDQDSLANISESSSDEEDLNVARCHHDVRFVRGDVWIEEADAAKEQSSTLSKIKSSCAVM